MIDLFKNIFLYQDDKLLFVPCAGNRDDVICMLIMLICAWRHLKAKMENYFQV